MITFYTLIANAGMPGAFCYVSRHSECLEINSITDK
jgi:hypothetical protein